MKAVWSFEPKSQDSAAIRGMMNLLGQFTERPRDTIVSFVVTENETYLHTAFDVPAKERLTSYPKRLILDELKKAKVRIDPINVRILHKPTLSTTASVQCLLKFASTQKADLIALYTNNKKGLERLIMGSFAETAIHHSKIDLLLAGPKTTYPSKVRSIFFTCDFGPRTRRDIRRVLDLCKRIRAHLTVFHAAEVTYRWSLDESNPEILAYRKKTKSMAEWIERECEKSQVPCSVVIKSEFESIPNLIFKEARSAKADLIVVSAKVGPLAALMGGSVTRNIVRQGTHPVLILKR
ncbi:MAG: universal stress protein [Calothrix sp. SM1_5_4]|nr:universal stress protein [Calothrix sp. SM1_5_4]